MAKNNHEEVELIDLAAERGVLAGVFRFGYDGFIEVDDIVNERTFNSSINSSIYRCFRHIFEKDQKSKPDLALLLSTATSLSLQSVFDGVDNQKVVRAITNFPVEIENLRTLAAKIAKLDITRRLVDRLGGAIEDLHNITGDEAMGHILAIAEEAITEFGASLGDSSTKGELLGDGALEYVQHLMDNPVEQMGIKTGFKLWDDSIGGGPKGGEVHLIGARAKSGKSFAANQMGLNISEQGISVFQADSELDKRMNIRRTTANISGVKMNLIKTGQAGKVPTDRLKVEDAARKLKDMPYTHCSIAGKPPEEIMAIMRRWLVTSVGLDENGKATKTCCIIFDYIKLMDDSAVTKNLQEHQALGFLMMSLVNFALKYNVPIIAFCQLNRDGMTREDEGAAAGSDRLIWFCSSFSILKWKSDDELAQQYAMPADQRYTHKLITLLARDGPALDPNQYINVKSEFHIGRLTEGPLNTNIESQGNIINGNTIPAFGSA